jgi:hypothetical protein
MKRVLHPLTALVFVAALLAPYFHRHAVHEEGVFAVHTDCTVCGWAQGQSAPTAASHRSASQEAAAPAAFALQARFMSASRAVSFFHSRAPPSLA